MGRISPAVSLLLIAVVLVSCAHGQVTTPCTASMVSSVSPCMGFLTNSSSNSSSPTSDCCNSLRSLTGSGMNCLCLIVAGGVPFNVPINRSLAIGLPRACNMPGVPIYFLMVAASSAPVPAPGPSSLAPSPAPESSSTPTAAPLAPEPSPSALAPEPETVPTLSPPSTTGTPTATNSGISPTTNLSNSASIHTMTLSPALLLSAIAFLGFNFH